MAGFARVGHLRILARAASAAVVGAAAALVLAAPSRAAATPGEVVLEGWVYEVEPNPVILGETFPRGTVLTRTRLAPNVRFRLGTYLRTSLAESPLDGAGGRWCLARGTLLPDEIQFGGRILPRESHDVLEVTALEAFLDPLDLRPPRRGAILRDLFARGVLYERDGTPTPEGGLSADGRSADGRRTRRVPLVTPPADSADMYTETAFVDVRGQRYWAVREGGLIGRSRWVGPFDLPRRRAGR